MNILEELMKPPLNFPLLWLIFFLIMAVAEMLTPFFGLILVGASGVVAAAVAGMGQSFLVQVIVFVIACAFSMVLVRPKIIRKLHSTAHVPGRTESLFGKSGEVTQGIESAGGQGRVTVEGQDWAAASDKPLALGSKIKVVGADGIVLKVAEKS
jgi:membrane protein implicated in regulation of membrane protease activity